MDTGDEGDEGRFAGAVLAEQHMHLAGTEVEIDRVEGDDARKVLGHALEAQKRRNARRTWSFAHSTLRPLAPPQGGESRTDAVPVLEHWPVFRPRSSNRTCGFPASGSP